MSADIVPAGGLPVSGDAAAIGTTPISMQVAWLTLTEQTHPFPWTTDLEAEPGVVWDATGGEVVVVDPFADRTSDQEAYRTARVVVLAVNAWAERLNALAAQLAATADALAPEVLS